MTDKKMNVNPFEIIQTVNEPLIVLDEFLSIIFGNRAFDKTFQTNRSLIEGNSIFKICEGAFDTREVHESLEAILTCDVQGEGFQLEKEFPLIGYRIFIINPRPMRRYTEATEKQILIRFEDVTEQKKAEKTLKLKTKEILELSTPVTKIWDEILVLPLIGTLDSHRANQMMEQLLEVIRDTGARYIIMDGTGMGAIDTAVAAHMLKATSAVKLLGAQVIMTGIRPDVAMTMVHLGIELGDIMTRATLQEGVQYAMNARGYVIVPRQALELKGN